MNTLPKVLVVDDDPVIGRSFDRVLSGKGYAVMTVNNGEDALRKLNDEHYDVVFTDIRMPGMCGLDVAHEIRKTQPWMPVVIITGYGTEPNETRARAVGVAGFLHKPLTPDMIEESARKALTEKNEAAEPSAKAITDDARQVQESRGVAQTAKNVALFFASPFIGLAYVVAFPFIGLGMLAWAGAKALKQHDVPQKAAAVMKKAGMFVAAPFIGLAYLIALPFMGMGMPAWMGARAMKHYHAMHKTAGALKTVGMLIAAPFIGLAYVIAFPFIGLGMLVWTGAKALIKR